MPISFNPSPLTNPRIALRGDPTTLGASDRGTAVQRLEQEIAVRDARTGLADAQGKVADLASRLASARPRTTPVPANTLSESLLGLSTTSSQATASSAEEVNTRSTAFGPTDPAFEGLSTVPVSVGGTFDGTQGTGTLTFVVTTPGLRGATELRIEARDPQDQPFDTIVIAPTDPVDKVFTLSNGLQLTFGDGILALDDQFTVDVQSGLVFNAEPDRPLDGSGGDPGLDEGQTVTDGSFEVNGASIAVSAADTVNDVLQRITASAADVSARFDAATDRVELIRKTAGAGLDITLDNDSSGFLAALKLDTALTAPGTSPDADLPLEQVAAFSTVSSGTFQVNGVDVTLDVTTDSLNDVIAHINGADANAAAELTSGDQLVRIRSLDVASDLVLADPDTGLLSALGITAGSFAPQAGSERLARRTVRELSEATEAAVGALNAALSSPTGQSVGTALDALRTELASVTERALGGEAGRALELGLGLALDFTQDPAATFGAEERRAFERTLVRDFLDLRELLIGSANERSDGLLASIEAALGTALDALGGSRRGTLLDVFA